MFEKLFQPITINKTEIKNRIVYPSLALNYSDDRKLNNRYMNFYREKAKGGAGIVTVGPCSLMTQAQGNHSIYR
jgi:2,4-dienoyl-CoA reductase (NADPH2)